MDDNQCSLEALGDQVTELAAHLNAATARWLRLIREFDAREGWARWECRSCAHWISWRCSIATGAAREHVRVARRLADLPLVSAAFESGELSYSKVRALTRLEEVEREQELLELARSCTAAQLERIVRGYRSVVAVEAGRSHDARFLRVTYDDDGSVLLHGRLAPDEGALVVQALGAARDALYAQRAADASDATTDADPAVDGPEARREVHSADALVALADSVLEHGLGGHRTGGDRYQVVVSIDATARTAQLENGTPLAVETTKRICCDASFVPVVEHEGQALSIGRKSRIIPPALRRALRRRDGGCQFPGCDQHRWVDAHHIVHWANGGETKLSNLVHLCRRHHRLLHEGDYTVRRKGTRFVFRRPDGTTIDALPRERRGSPGCLIDANHRNGHRMAPTTTVPQWYGDRLDAGAAVDALLTFAPIRPPGATPAQPQVA